MSQNKLKGLEKILRAGLEIGKYPAYAIVLGSALGCVEIPKPITASRDGRYVAFSVTDEGKMDIDSSKESRIAVIDTQKNQFYFMEGKYQTPLWLSTDGNKVAFVTEGDKKSNLCDVYIASRNEHQVIKDASYPVLSSDGNYLAYVREFKEKVKVKVPILPPEIRRVPRAPPAPAPPPFAPAPAPAPKAPPLPVPRAPPAPAPKVTYGSESNTYLVSMQFPPAPKADPSEPLENPQVPIAPAPAPPAAPMPAPTPGPIPRPIELFSPPTLAPAPAPQKQQYKEVIKNIVKTKLFVRDLRSGLETKIDDEGLVSDFSPDSNYLLYLKDQPFDPKQEEEIDYKDKKDKDKEPPLELYVCERNGDGKSLISLINFGDSDDSTPLYPCWISNNEIMFQTKTERTGKDTEIFTYNVKTKTMQQITDNDAEELLPQFKDNKIYYETAKIIDNTNPKNPKYDITFFVAQRDSEGEWMAKKLNIKPYFYAIAGNNIYYIEDEESKLPPEPPMAPGKPYKPKKPVPSTLYVTTLDEIYKAHPNITELTPTLKAK